MSIRRWQPQKISTPITNPPHRRSRLGLAVLGVCILLAGLFGLRAYNAPKPTLRAALAEPVSSHGPWTKSIQDVFLGERTLGTNPLTEERERALPDPDPKTWRELHFHMLKANGLSLWIELLRSLEWIEAVGAAEGNSIYLELPEMGAVGQAKITYLGPCPPIQPGEGNVVTGKFVHEADGNVVELRLEGQPEPTRVTDNHPYWSEDRQAFVPAGELRPDERVRTAHGTTQVVSVKPIAYKGFLYNLETYREHVYMVGSLGTLVHNNCIAPKPARNFMRHAPSRTAGALKKRLGRPPVSMKKPQAHHDLPQEFHDKFKKAGLDIEDPAYGRWVEGGPVGDHQKWSKQFNKEWREFFDETGKPTRRKILNFMNKLRKDPRFQ